jgi:hypothetical protein
MENNNNLNPLTLRSSIRSELMRFTLWKGSCLAGIGALLLLFGGTFVPLQQLKVWGFPIFISACALITWGLLPYRRLRTLETSPYVLTLPEEKWLCLSAKGKIMFKLPLESISHFKYLEFSHFYGIGIYLKNRSNDQEIVEKSKKWNLFLPYFSQRSYQTLKEHLEIVKN